ncbi:MULTISPECIES: hypothetical protein [unclassified Paenibacillus]|uniref:hypothetical protein n=1 Tax=unclassified Paenibacillus TaxID=185978 RepID=UPI00117C8A87|nr:MULTISPECIES: hypothetical protein [unclassified Paenibacillus]UYO02570.1 hypothetical protein K2F33_22860 [Paenibacillus sp. PSB04]
MIIQFQSSSKTTKHKKQDRQQAILLLELSFFIVEGQEHSPMESRYFSGFFCFIGTSSCPDYRNGQELEPITDINGKLLDAFYEEARRLGDDLESLKKSFRAC